MSYVDAIVSKDKETIHVVERTRDGSRVFRDYQAKHEFYYPSNSGKHRGIDGRPLTRVSCRTNKEFRKEISLNSGKQLYVSSYIS